MKTIVIGLGNPILGDDGVGWRVAMEVDKQLPANPPVDVDCVSLGGISLMERLIGYDRAILIDAFMQEESLGSILVLKLSDLPNYSAFHMSSAHDTSLQNAIELGRSMGAPLPKDVEIIGIATRRVCDFTEELSPPIADVVPFAARVVLDLLKQDTRRKEEYQLQR